MSLIGDDALAIVTGFGSVKVVKDGVSTRGLFDDEHALLSMDDGDAAQTRVRVLRIVTGALGTVAAESSVQVGTLDSDTALTTYRVLDVWQEADGLVTRLTLA